MNDVNDEVSRVVVFGGCMRVCALTWRSVATNAERVRQSFTLGSGSHTIAMMHTTMTRSEDIPCPKSSVYLDVVARHRTLLATNLP